VPAFPLQPICLENGFDHAVSEVVQIQRPANRIREQPPRSILRLDRVEQEPKRLDDRNDAGVFVILATSFVIFGSRAAVRDDVLAFVVFPFVIWSAIRFRVAGAAVAGLLVATVAVLGYRTGVRAIRQTLSAAQRRAASNFYRRDIVDWAGFSGGNEREGADWTSV